VIGSSGPATAAGGMRRLGALAMALACAVTAAGCGGASRGATSAGNVAVALDFTPNPAHAPLYLAAHQGYDRRFGIHLSIVVPGSGPDTVQLLSAHRADIGVLDIDDLTEDLQAASSSLGDAAGGGSHLVGKSLDDVERHYIAETLKLTEGNREEAARLLGIGERTLYRKLKEYGIG